MIGIDVSRPSAPARRSDAPRACARRDVSTIDVTPTTSVIVNEARFARKYEIEMAPKQSRTLSGAMMASVPTSTPVSALRASARGGNHGLETGSRRRGVSGADEGPTATRTAVATPAARVARKATRGRAVATNRGRRATSRRQAR
jgi:hypothetical protein